MKKTINRVVGIFLLTSALFGLFLALVGLSFVIQKRGALKNQVTQGLDLLDRSLQTTAAGLSVMQSSLQQTQANVVLIKTITGDVAAAVGKATPAMQTTADMVGKDFTVVLDDTQTALASAAASAALIDDTLGVLSRIPLVGPAYAPKVPLQKSIQQVSDSLGGVSPSLVKVAAALNSSTQDMEDIRTQVGEMSESIGAVETRLVEAQEVIGQYQGIVAELQGGLSSLQKRAGGWVDLGAWGLIGFFVWMLAVQVGLSFQGIQLMKPD